MNETNILRSMLNTLQEVKALVKTNSDRQANILEELEEVEKTSTEIKEVLLAQAEAISSLTQVVSDQGTLLLAIEQALQVPKAGPPVAIELVAGTPIS